MLQRVAIAVLVLGILVPSVFAIDSPQRQERIERMRRYERRGVTERWEEYRRDYLDINNKPAPVDGAGSFGPEADQPHWSVVNDRRTGGTLLGAMGADTIFAAGALDVGITSYDLQANYALGHQIATLAGATTVHWTYTMWDRVPDSIEANDRFVNYSAWNKLTSTQLGGYNGTQVGLGNFARAGFAHIDVSSTNQAHASFHQKPAEGLQYACYHLEFPIEGSTLHLDHEMPTFPTAPTMFWTELSQSHRAPFDANTDVWHTIARGGEEIGHNPRPSDRIWYWRYDRATAGPWAGPVLVDSSGWLGYTMDASDISDRVAIAYHTGYNDDIGESGPTNSVNNVAYHESVTSGLGWLNGSELGPGTEILVTDYNDPSGPIAWSETSVLYDHDDDLHIIFTEQRRPGSEHMGIRHWRRSRGTLARVVNGYYDNDGIWARSTNISHISLGVGDGSTFCMGGAESNRDYLYATYTKLCGETPEEQADMSRLGFCNGEVYHVASHLNGDAWSPPLNLTNTKLPECTATNLDSLCPSEAWVTMARTVGPDIEIFYIHDFESGYFAESGWTMNRAMYLNLPGGTTDADFLCPIIAPVFDAEISVEPECEYHANAGATNFETLTISNTGNNDMTGAVTITAGNSWLGTTEGAYLIVPAAANFIEPVTMDAGLLTEGLYSGTIEITHNDTTKPSPRVFPIDFFVVDDFNCPEQAVLKTAVASPGVLALEVGSGARFGAANPTGGLWRFVDSSSSIFDASFMLAHGAQSPDTIVYHRFYERDDPGQHGFRALSELELDTLGSYGSGTGAATATSRMTTRDSTISIWIEWFFPQDPVYADFVVAKYTVANRTSSPIENVMVGIYIDLDVMTAIHNSDLQEANDNHGNYVSSQNLIYQYGHDTIGHSPFQALNSSMRYSGGISYMHGRDAVGDAFSFTPVALRGGVGDNRVNQVNDGPSSTLLYETFVGPAGVTVWEQMQHPDSSKDQYTWLTLDQGRTLAPSGADPEIYIVALVSDTMAHHIYPQPGKSMSWGLEDAVNLAWSWAAQHVDTRPADGCPCDCHTQPECDGVTNVLDVAAAVDVAFRGAAPEPDPSSYCTHLRTDTDCNNVTNVLDVVRFVNVAFRDADPASQFCNPCTL